MMMVMWNGMILVVQKFFDDTERQETKQEIHSTGYTIQVDIVEKIKNQTEGYY